MTKPVDESSQVHTPSTNGVAQRILSGQDREEDPEVLVAAIEQLGLDLSGKIAVLVEQYVKPHKSATQDNNPAENELERLMMAFFLEINMAPWVVDRISLMTAPQSHEELIQARELLQKNRQTERIYMQIPHAVASNNRKEWVSAYLQWEPLDMVKFSHDGWKISLGADEDANPPTVEWNCALVKGCTKWMNDQQIDLVASTLLDLILTSELDDANTPTNLGRLAYLLEMGRGQVKSIVSQRGRELGSTLDKNRDTYEASMLMKAALEGVANQGKPRSYQRPPGM